MAGSKRNRIFAGLFGAALGAAVLLGSVLEKNGALSAPDGRTLIKAAGTGILAALFCLVFWSREDRRTAGEETQKTAVSPEKSGNGSGSEICGLGICRWGGKLSRRKQALLLWGILMAVEAVSLLAVYPGFFVYDAAEELAMAQTRSFTTHHPLLHVLLLGGTILAGHKVTGSWNAGICLWMLLQMAVMDAAFVYVLCDLKRRRTAKGVRVFGFLWYAFCPVITMYVLCSCKDGLFSAALIVMTVLLRRILTEDASSGKEERGIRLFFVLTAALIMLLRNNGVYAYAVFLVLLLAGGAVRIRRQNGRGAEKKSGESGNGRKEESGLCRKWAGRALLFLLPLALYLGGTKGMILVTGASSAESQEILTVPIMQLARVWNASPEDFSEEEKQAMESFMEPGEAWSAYNPVLSDQVKLHFDSAAYRENKASFWKLWVSGGISHPAAYLNAWLMTSYGFWTPGAVIDCYRGNTVYTFTYGDSSYFGYETELPGVRESRIPALDRWYRFLSLDVRAQKLFVPGIFLSCGVMAWIFFFVLADLLRKRQWAVFLSYLPVLMVWMTVLLGPCTLPRYVVYLWIGLPCFLSECFDGRKAQNGSKNRLLQGRRNGRLRH